MSFYTSVSSKGFFQHIYVWNNTEIRRFFEEIEEILITKHHKLFSILGFI